MPHPLSTLGIAHTAISLVPLVAGLASFVRHRRIDPASTSGRVYLVGLAASVLTSFGLSSKPISRAHLTRSARDRAPKRSPRRLRYVSTVFTRSPSSSAA